MGKFLFWLSLTLDAQAIAAIMEHVIRPQANALAILAGLAQHAAAEEQTLAVAMANAVTKEHVFAMQTLEHVEILQIAQMTFAQILKTVALAELFAKLLEKE